MLVVGDAALLVLDLLDVGPRGGVEVAGREGPDVERGRAGGVGGGGRLGGGAAARPAVGAEARVRRELARAPRAGDARVPEPLARAVGVAVDDEARLALGLACDREGSLDDVSKKKTDAGAPHSSSMA